MTTRTNKLCDESGVSRRQALKIGAQGIALGLLGSGVSPLPPLFGRTSEAVAATEGKILVVFEWFGGYDGLSTFVPYGDDELFNTRVSTYYGYERAMRKLIPTPRGGARIDMTQMILDSGAATTGEAVDYLLARFLRVPLAPGARDAMVEFLEGELGTSDIGRAQTYMEDPLRMVSHLIMSTPEYQIN